MPDRLVRRSEEVHHYGRNSGNRPVGDAELTIGVRLLVRRSTEADVASAITADYAALTAPGRPWATTGRRRIGGRPRSPTGD